MEWGEAAGEGSVANSEGSEAVAEQAAGGKGAGKGAADRGREGRPMRELRTVAGKDARDADEGGAWRKGPATA